MQNLRESSLTILQIVRLATLGFLIIPFAGTTRASPCGSNCPVPPFIAARSFAVGPEPRSLVVADFNGDGWLDIASANHGFSVSILLGDGSGGFVATGTISVDGTPIGMVLGDFNADQKVDLAVANENSDSVSILKGIGDGTFTLTGNLVVGKQPQSLTVADLNRDGIQDIIVANRNFDNNDLSILIGDGAGSFGAASQVSVDGLLSFGTVAADFNSDGNLDLAVGVDGATGNFYNITVLNGNGLGGFSGSSTFALSNGVLALITQDVNGDNKPDLVAAMLGQVQVLQGNGNGGFATSTNYPVAEFVRSLTAADYNGDGNIDIAGLDQFTRKVYLLVGNGAGAFSVGGSFVATGGLFESSMSSGDFNADGRPDLVTAQVPVSGVNILFNDGNGGFVTAETVDVMRAFSLANGDFNTDGNPDVAVTNRQANTVSILLGNGLGFFSLASTIPVGQSPVFVVATDISGDGHLDLVVANVGSNNVLVLLGDGSSGFNSGTVIPLASGPTSLAVADFTGDGHKDLAIVNPPDSVSLLAGNGTGQFAASTTLAVGSNPQSVESTDFNNDGKADLVVVSQNKAEVFLGNGQGGLSLSSAHPVGGGLGVTTGDLNHDGNDDFVVVGPGVVILLGDGLGGFSGPNFIPTNSISPITGILRDLDNDSNLDLVVTSGSGFAGLLTLKGNGLGGFGSQVAYLTGSSTRSVTSADINLDGSPDLITANLSSNNIAILLNRCVPAIDVTPPSIVAPPDVIMTIGSGALACTALISDSTLGTADAADDCGEVSISRSGVPPDNLFPVGVNTVTYTATDGAGNIAVATQLVTVMNPPPILGNYPATILNLGTNGTVMPDLAPSDNGTLLSLTAITPSFIGTIMGDPETGILTIRNAGPSGVYNVTVSATDNCGATSNTSFALEVNSPPSITGVTLNRQQGTFVSNSQIATIADPNQSPSTLTVNANLATGSGVIVSNITINSAGQVFADVVAGCTAVSSTFTLIVTDNQGAIAIATLTVSAIANTPPALGTYPAVTVNPGTNIIVTPTVASTDNGSITLLTASASGFTGTLTGNTSTGAITVSNAAPSGVYTVTVTATDNCGAVSTRTFALRVNTPPTITGATISRQQGSSASVSQIGAVSDVDQAANTLGVMVNGGTGVTVNGVTVNNLSVDPLGNLTASVVASCSATNASFIVTATDDLGLTASATLMVNVLTNTSPFLGNYPSAGTLNLGASTTVTPDAVPNDNGSINVTATAPGFTGSLSVDPSNGVVTVINAGPKGNYNVTVTATDNCGATVSRIFTLRVKAH